MLDDTFFTGTELIADILEIFPEAAEILAANGIACANCYVNQYETLRDGILGHGHSEEVFLMILSDLNEAAKDMGIEKNAHRKKDFVLTDTAKNQILTFQEESKKQGFGLKIEVTRNREDASYFLDFQEFPDKGDRVFRVNGIKIFCDEDSFRWLKNKKMDYMVLEDAQGFKFEAV